MGEFATPAVVPSWAAVCRVRGGPVVSELIEGEIIAINLDSGDYYSFTGLAAQLWQRMLQPVRFASIAEQVAAQPDTSPEAALYTAATFARRLQEEGLIVIDGALPQPLPVGLPTALAAMIDLQRFSDVAELLKLDPVHDVDEVGWPVKAKDEPAPATGDGAL